MPCKILASRSANAKRCGWAKTRITSSIWLPKQTSWVTGWAVSTRTSITTDHASRIPASSSRRPVVVGSTGAGSHSVCSVARHFSCIVAALGGRAGVFYYRLADGFLSRSPFNTFKAVLVEFSVALPQRLPRLWQTYFLVRRRALLAAMLPAAMAFAGRLLGLEKTPVLLLVLTSLLLLWLYRTPRQLW